MPDPEKKLKRAIIKEELVALTGEWLKAVILQQFLYWGERVKDFDAFILEERLRKNEPDLELTHGWIWKSAKDLKEEIMVTPLSEDTVRRRMAELVKAGWLEERNNPYHAWDRTLQYRPSLRRIQKDLQTIGYALEHYPLLFENSPIPQGAESKPQDEESSPQGAESNPQSAGAIPEITPETTPKINLDDSPKGSKEPATPAQAMFSALAHICRIDLATLTKEQRGALNQSEKRLRKAGAVPDDLTQFEAWWYAHDWRGKKGEAPEPHQVREEWGRFTGWRKKHNGFTPTPDADIQARLDAGLPETDPLAETRTTFLMACGLSGNAAASHFSNLSINNGHLVISISKETASKMEAQPALREAAERGARALDMKVRFVEP